jgi:hypothetical protein
MPVINMISIQSIEPPPPPPPLPAVAVTLASDPVTVRDAEAGAELPPAGPVIKSLAATAVTYAPAVALCTLTETVQLPFTGTLAPASVTLPVVLVSEIDAPSQELVGAGVPKLRPFAKAITMPD